MVDFGDPPVALSTLLCLARLGHAGPIKSWFRQHYFRREKMRLRGRYPPPAAIAPDISCLAEPSGAGDQGALRPPVGNLRTVGGHSNGPAAFNWST